jgi:AcrR family transcriptional regulator
MPNESAAQNKPTHHHGNLREALVDAGLVLLANEGAAGLTLRKCAALAGVSHAAPAHHFRGLNGLLTAIAARGFTLFAQAMQEKAALAPAEPRARLEAICLAYYDYARTNPAVFDLMFRQIWTIAVDDAELSAAGAQAYGVLAEACAPFASPDGEVGTVEIQVWGLIHGYSALALAGKLGRNRAQAPVKAVLALLEKLELRA